MLRCAQHDNGETELVPPVVTLSTFVPLSVNSAKGLARWAERCFAALSMTRLYRTATLRLRLMRIGADE